MSKLCNVCLHALVLVLPVLLPVSPLKAADLTAQGSDSTLPLVKALVEEFQKASGKSIAVSGGGSSLGAKACMEGKISLAFLSRALKEKEKERGLIGAAYALDGVAVVVNMSNPQDDISIEELRNIFSGAQAAWQDGKPVVAFTRSEDSGTREVFQERVLGEGLKFGEKVGVKHDMALRPAITGIPTSIGYTSAGNVDTVKFKVLRVNGVAPNFENLRAGKYPISRTPTLATLGEPAGTAKDFIAFVLSPAGAKVIREHGYVPLK